MLRTRSFSINIVRISKSKMRIIQQLSNSCYCTPSDTAVNRPIWRVQRKRQIERVSLVPSGFRKGGIVFINQPFGIHLNNNIRRIRIISVDSFFLVPRLLCYRFGMNPLCFVYFNVLCSSTSILRHIRSNGLQPCFSMFAWFVL